jgi:hypothetical protein
LVGGIGGASTHISEVRCGAPDSVAVDDAKVSVDTIV